MCKKLYALCLMYFHCMYGINIQNSLSLLFLIKGLSWNPTALTGNERRIKQLAEEGIFTLMPIIRMVPSNRCRTCITCHRQSPLYHVLLIIVVRQQGEIVRCHKNAIEKGPSHLNVDALSDQHTIAERTIYIYSLSFKNRSAIMMAGHLATPFV